jgi:hypothetical protein
MVEEELKARGFSKLSYSMLIEAGLEFIETLLK